MDEGGSEHYHSPCWDETEASFLLNLLYSFLFVFGDIPRSCFAVLNVVVNRQIITYLSKQRTDRATVWPLLGPECFLLSSCVTKMLVEAEEVSRPGQARPVKPLSLLFCKERRGVYTLQQT